MSLSQSKPQGGQALVRFVWLYVPDQCAMDLCKGTEPATKYMNERRSSGVVRVSHRLVEVNHAIKFTAAANCSRQSRTLLCGYTLILKGSTSEDCPPLSAQAAYHTSIPAADTPQIVSHSRKCGSHQARRVMPDECYSRRHIASDAICRRESRVRRPHSHCACRLVKLLHDSGSRT